MKHQQLILLTVALASVHVGCSAEFQEKFATYFDRKSNKPQPDPSEVKDAPTPRIAPETHYASGLMLERQGDFAGAAGQFEKAAEGDPAMVEAHNRLGMCLCRMGRNDEARASFQRAVKLSPDSAALRNNLGFCLNASGRYAEAEAAFRKALELTPDFDRARMTLGIALARQKKLGDAAVEFSRVVPAETAYYNVGVICMEMNENAHAERAFRESLAVKPDYAPAQKRLAMVRDAGGIPANSTAARPQGRVVEPPRVTVRSNEPVGVMTLAGDSTADAPSP